jgi:hypothetical protein
MPRRALEKVSDARLTSLRPASASPAATSSAWRASRISPERRVGPAASTETGTQRIRSRPRAFFTVPVPDLGQASRPTRGPGGGACAPPPRSRRSQSGSTRPAILITVSRSRCLPRPRRPARAYPTRRRRADPSHRPRPTCNRRGSRPGPGCSPPPGSASTTS